MSDNRCRRASLLLIAAVLLGACSADNLAENPAADSGEEVSASPSPIGSTLAESVDRCGDPAASAEMVELVAADGTELAAVHAGSGKVGIVLGHQYPSDLCDWWSYLGHLAGSGFNVVAIDFRCYGESACPEGAASGDLLVDIEVAIKFLQRERVGNIFYIGASMGGTLAYAAGSELADRLDGVINLSGGGDFTALTGSPFVDAPRYAPRIKVPFLSVAARGDLPGDELRAEFAAVPEADKQLVMLPSTFGHGVAMLFGDQTGEWSRLDGTIQAWLRKRS